MPKNYSIKSNRHQMRSVPPREVIQHPSQRTLKSRSPHSCSRPAWQCSPCSCNPSGHSSCTPHPWSYGRHLQFRPGGRRGVPWGTASPRARWCCTCCRLACLGSHAPGSRSSCSCCMPSRLYSRPPCVLASSSCCTGSRQFQHKDLVVHSAEMCLIQPLTEENNARTIWLEKIIATSPYFEF